MTAVSGRLPLIEPMLAAPARDVPANTDDWAASWPVGFSRDLWVMLSVSH
jgi:hypothetical protein